MSRLKESVVYNRASCNQINTAEEYLEAQVNSQNRHEFLNGEMVLMTGDTPNHNKISSN